ncbi:MAG: phytanoyl-CoA dioxygenase family protein [Elusimicrobia bacterium]|nr:phytanoyl-CoA dioxygenase family protein [Elusimicrobiota bacterium]
MKLSLARKRRLARDGYVVLPRVVPAALTDAAVREINHRLGAGAPPDGGAYAVEPDWRSEHAASASVMDLLHRTPIPALLESLLGAGNVEPCFQAQVALRFPSVEGSLCDYDPHIDGFSPNEELHRFTLLVGVLLSDCPRPDMGNFAVYPGTHLRSARYLKEHGIDALRPGPEGRLDLPEAVPVTGKAGDVVLCHHQLVHAKGKNLSPHIRYMAYYRIYHAAAWRDRSREYLERALTDVWLEWPSMRGVHGA